MNKHTPGPVSSTRKYKHGSGRYFWQIQASANTDKDAEVIAEIACRYDIDNSAEEAANCGLIEEAFNVATETGLTPRQLVEQRAELISMLETALPYVASVSDDDCAAKDATLIRAILAKCGKVGG